MGVVVFVTCIVTSLICTVLLFRAWRQTRSALLFWSALCFTGLTLHNVGVVVDLVLVPEVDLAVPRKLPALIGVALLVFGLSRELR